MKRIHISSVAVGALLYAVYMFGSCVIVMLVEALLSRIINSFVLLSYPTLTVIRIVIYSLGVPAVIGVVAHREGYSEAAFSLPETVLSGVLAMLPHLLFSMLFKFQAFSSGAVRFTAGLIHNGWTITAESLVERTPYFLFLLIFFLYGLLYIGVICLFKYLGCTRRLAGRMELKRNHTEA